MTYRQQERRNYVQLSNEDFERIANRAKEIAKSELYKDVGKAAISAAYFWLRWLLVSGLIAASAWFAAHGYIK